MKALYLVWDSILDVLNGVEKWAFSRKHATYGLALSRILVGVACLGILVANFSKRQALWGAASGWIEPLRADAAFGSLHELFGGGPTWFTVKYLILGAVAVAVIVGWRTRAATLLLVVGMTALVERNGLVGDQGDNIARIGLFLMLFMSTSEHWSLDERRRRRQRDKATTSADRRVAVSFASVPAWFTNVVHNLALVALALQLFILYTASAMFKMQGDYWQGGTALFYPLSLHEYAVFPWLNDLLVSNPVGVTVATYFAVFVQLFFAVGLLHPVTRRLALVGVILLHLGIAVMMGLPWFSLSMLAFDAIFVSAATYMLIETKVGPVVARAGKRAGEILPRKLVRTGRDRELAQ